MNRFKTGDEEWYRSQSKAPKNQGRETRKESERAVVGIRKALMVGNEQESKYLGVGADAVQYRMQKLGFSEDEIPSVSTIKRIVNPKSPWMNGSIENFNKWFGEKFWDKETFTSLEDMRTESKHFVDQHNALSAWKSRNKSLERINPAKILNNSLKISLDKLPLTGGKIHFIRKVDNEGQISVLNEAFNVGKEFIGEYVWATICLAERKLGPIIELKTSLLMY